LVLLSVILCLVAVHVAPAAQHWGAGEAAGITAAAPAPAAEPTVTDGLTIRQRREMGLTVANVRKVLVAKQKAGELDGKSTEELAVEVLNELVAANPKAFSDPAIDWDKLIAFIEKLIPLILKIIALFGGV